MKIRELPRVCKHCKDLILPPFLNHCEEDKNSVVCQKCKDKKI